MEALKSLCELSKSENKGLTVYMKGQTVPGLVTEVSDDTVTLKSQEYSKIVIRLESIDGAALS